MIECAFFLPIFPNPNQSIVGKELLHFLYLAFKQISFLFDFFDLRYEFRWGSSFESFVFIL